MDSLPLGSDHTDGQKPSEYCAVVGYKGGGEALDSLLTSLKTLQHRGQESAGIAVFKSGSVQVHKGMGLVSEVFNPKYSDFSFLDGSRVGIGHTRYSTAGRKTVENAGPFVVSSSVGYIAISHNGEITNAEQLKESMKRRGATFQTTSDTEVMLMEISRDVNEFGIVNGIKQAMNRLKGAYSATLLINDRLFAIRDPHGFRPLVIGRLPDGYLVASESCAIDVLGGELLRDVMPGEVVEIREDGLHTLFVQASKSISHCMFEYVYFARPDSIIDGREVFDTRIELGRRLAREHPVDADLVIPVPDSGRSQALGYSMESGIPYNEGLIKNRFSERTFIMPTQEQRRNAVKVKLNAIKSTVKDKRVVLVDDSIVRGNTMKHIVDILRRAGAREIHVRIGSPEIIAPCYFGVDMKTKDQFIAAGRTTEEIRKEIGADSLGYVSIEGLVDAIGFPAESLCLGCLTGKYPVTIPGERHAAQSELENF
ncbi:amidophosphoribosyltransferase [Thermogymnomonas acidicola]|uniref:Amidophosphoribosyltransferase n=1 Tax=Thermogymnomonas acidicola TaxID=399579 RepID=A0AA37BRR4_9ARCH|nr:amidophosphoribosyltransferase [Thermogymnomonas acidicola]GGM72120.1 amidophosphoribosyltransferase [Thermogymnomonas acidicola]